MKKLNSFAYIIIISAGLFIGTSTNQVAMAESFNTESIQTPVIKNEVSAILITTEKNNTLPQPSKFSYNAADLLAKQPLELDNFCKNYPLNSRCANISSPSSSQSEKTKPRDQKSQVTASTSGWAITPKISTLGAGATVTKSVTPHINAQVGISGLGINGDIVVSGVNYDAKLNLFNVSTLVEYHPWKDSGFHLTGGMVFQNNHIEGTGKASNGSTIKIGDTEYPTEQVPLLKTKASLPNRVAPYIGIGWGNAVKPGKSWNFSANLGVMFAGSPKVEITPIGVDPRLLTYIQADIDKEEKELENDLEWLNIYPVLSVGVSYQF